MLLNIRPGGNYDNSISSPTGGIRSSPMTGEAAHSARVGEATDAN